MTRRPVSYLRHRFPPEIISHGVWLYHRFCLSFPDVEDLLAQRGARVSYESIRQWCAKFGREYARRLRRREGRLGDTWHVDELFLTDTRQYANNRAEVSHQATRQRERQMRRFKSRRRRNGSCPCMQRFRMRSGWAGISCGQSITGCSGSVPSVSGPR